VTEKLPHGMGVERWIDQQVREARDRGDFDNLPGYGKPLTGVDQPYDELWWAREFIEREKLPLLPETLRLRREIELFKERLRAMRLEPDVRVAVQELNERIFIANSLYSESPPVPVWPLDEERIVERWRRERLEAHLTPVVPAAVSRPPTAGPVPTRSGVQRSTRLWLAVLMAAVAALSIAASIAAL